MAIKAKTKSEKIKAGSSRDIAARMRAISKGFLAKEHKDTRLCHYACWKNGEKHPYIRDNEPCYSSMTNPSGFKAITLLVTQHRKGSVYTYDSKTAIPYLKWLMNDSYWAPAFLSKSPKYALKHGFRMNMEVPFLIVHGACIAVREVWEFSFSNRVWKMLVDKGIDPAVAHVCTHLFRVNTKIGSNQIVPHQRSIHSILSYTTCPIRYKNKDPKGCENLKDKASTWAASYWGSQALFIAGNFNVYVGKAKRTVEGFEQAITVDDDFIKLIKEYYDGKP